MPELTNFAFGYLLNGISSTDLSFTLRSGQGARFPSASFYCVIYDAIYNNAAEAYQSGGAEVVLVSSRTVDAFTITRAQLATTARSFNTPYHLYKVTLDVMNIHILPSQANANGHYLKSVSGDAAWTHVPASDVANTPAGTIAATDVQTAINELDTEKEPSLPDQTGNAGAFLQTNGTTKSWQHARIFFTWHMGASPAANTTRYLYANAINVNEVGLPVPAGTIRNLKCYAVGNASINTQNITIRVNGIDSAVTCNAVASSPGTLTEDTVHTATTVNGDRVSVKDAYGSNGNFSCVSLSVSFELYL